MKHWQIETPPFNASLKIHYLHIYSIHFEQCCALCFAMCFTQWKRESCDLANGFVAVNIPGM